LRIGIFRTLFDSTVAERRQFLHRGRFIFKKHLSGGRNYWRYGSTSAVRRCDVPDCIGLRLHGQVTVLDRRCQTHNQQILATYKPKHCGLRRPV